MKFKFNATEILTKDGVSFVVPFILITACFALWGFANDMTGPIVKAFSKIFRMSATEGSLVQVAFYLGYFVMAFPAAIFIQRYSFKKGVMMGLSLFAIGSLMFLPAKMLGFYYPFLLAYFILTCGLSFLETSCNPYIYCMGSEETATQRLNLAQAFNRFYYECRILDDDMGKRAARLQLTTVVRDLIKTALYLIGVEAPERM